MIVTLLASLRPAIRATRVPPIAAVREGATLPRDASRGSARSARRSSRPLGFAALLYGIFGHGLGTTKVLLWMGLGTLFIFLGVALLSARFVRPLVVVLSPGRALDGLPLHRARLAVLPPSVLAPPLRRVGARIDGQAGARLRRPAVSERARAPRRARHDGAARRLTMAPGVARRVPRCRTRQGHGANRCRQLASGTRSAPPRPPLR